MTAVGRFTTLRAGSLWSDLDVDFTELDNEALEYHQRVAEEIAGRLKNARQSSYDKRHILFQPCRDPSSRSVRRGESSRPLAQSTAHAHVTSDRSVNGNEDIANLSIPRSFVKAKSSPNLSRMTDHTTLPSISTPMESSTPLPAPFHRDAPLRLRHATLRTPEFVPSPIDTPRTAGERATDRPASPIKKVVGDSSPRPLGSGVFASLRGKKDYQTLTKHFEDFSKAVAKREAANVDPMGKWRGARSTKAVPGLGGNVFAGLRFCIPPELGQVNKHKHRWDIISKLGGQVTLQPDTATTHIVWDGKSESALLRELGLSSYSVLPTGTICVRWNYISECKLTGILLEPSTYLTFRNPFGRQFPTSALPNLNTRAVVTAPPKVPLTHPCTSNDARITGIASDADMSCSIAISRKRQHTASDSDTESPRKPARTYSTRSALSLGPAKIAVPLHKNLAMRALQAQQEPSVATEHRLPKGPGWEMSPENGRDGLDEFISGVVNGTIKETDDEDTEVIDDVGEPEHSRTRGDGDGKDGDPDPTGSRYRCGQRNDGTSTSPNEFLAKKFEELHDLYLGVQGKSPFAIRQYQQAASICRRTLRPITSGKDALKIKGVGKSIADRIDEFLTGAQGRQFYEDNDVTRTIALFKDIYGVGRTFANELYRRGARSIEDLKTHDYGLTAGQMIGVELYDDLKARIPREECRQLYDIIRAEALAIDPKVWIEIMGSYRRGQETSGDVDILITRDTADGLNHSCVLKRLVDRLQIRGIITHDLSLPHNWRALEAKWMGVGRLDSNSRHRRIDILCIPFEQWGAALIYFTGGLPRAIQLTGGNEIFNRSLRLYARKKGYSLNQRGLYRGVIRDKQGQKMTEGELVASRTEKDIFDVLAHLITDDPDDEL